MPPGVAAVTAARGRGKSALAGQLISRIAGSAIVTAPAKAATDVLAQFAGEKFRFIAPDALLASDEQADWLVVDEAAAIPAPLLHQLVSRFPRTLLTTTVQGYEGTGRGFLLKFCARFPHLHRFELQQPIRWAQGCPLEKMVSEALVFDDENFTHTPQGNIVISARQTLWPERARNAVKGLSVIVWCALPDFAAGFTPDDGCTRAIFFTGGWRKRDCRGVVAGG